MQKIYLFTVILLFLSFNAFSQSVQDPARKAPNSWEVGGFLALNNFYGDLVQPDVLSLKSTRLSLGGFGRLYLSDPLDLRISFSYGRLAASDLDYEEKANRGISFTRNMAEFAAVMEWEPFNKGLYDGTGTFQKSVSPYLFGGLGLLLGKPSLDYENSSVESSTGARMDQNNLKSGHFIVPIGLGLKFYTSESSTFSFEYGLRPVFNDYLEGVSNAGNPEANDWYGVFSLMLAKRLNTK